MSKKVSTVKTVPWKRKSFHWRESLLWGKKASMTEIMSPKVLRGKTVLSKRKTSPKRKRYYEQSNQYDSNRTAKVLIGKLCHRKRKVSKKGNVIMSLNRAFQKENVSQNETLLWAKKSLWSELCHKKGEESPKRKHHYYQKENHAINNKVTRTETVPPKVLIGKTVTSAKKSQGLKPYQQKFL